MEKRRPFHLTQSSLEELIEQIAGPESLERVKKIFNKEVELFKLLKEANSNEEFGALFIMHLINFLSLANLHDRESFFKLLGDIMDKIDGKR